MSIKTLNHDNLITYIRQHLATSKGPRYQRIATAIRQLVDNNILQADEQLPTHRALAEAIGVSVQTVSFAYTHAIKAGFLTARIGSGTFVSGEKPGQEVHFLQNHPEIDSRQVDFSILGAATTINQKQAYQQTLIALANDATALNKIQCLKPFSGDIAYRENLLAWLASRRGITAKRQQLCLTNGATHALLIALSSVAAAGATLACEALTDHGLIALARTLNLRLEGVAVDEYGIIPEELARCCEQKPIAAICLTPTLHNPTTATLPTTRRQTIADIAKLYGIPVIEDDVFGVLDSQNLLPISHYLPEQSYYIGSFSKVAAAGLRIGYLIAPSNEMPQVIARLRASSWMANPLAASIANHWLTNGTIDNLITEQRGVFNKRQALAEQLLVTSTATEFRLQSQPDGALIWLSLPPPWRSRDFIKAVRQADVLLTAADPFVVGHHPTPNAIRISLSAVTNNESLQRGVKIIADLLTNEPPLSTNEGGLY